MVYDLIDTKLRQYVNSLIRNLRDYLSSLLVLHSQTELLIGFIEYLKTLDSYSLEQIKMDSPKLFDVYACLLYTSPSPRDS